MDFGLAGARPRRHPSWVTAALVHRPHDVDAVERCPSCGAPIDTPFCPACGEQRGSDRHYSLRHFAEEVIETFTHADGRIARTLRLLVTRPGALTLAYLRGERRPYMAPLQLFLLTNVVFFVWASVTRTDTFSTPLRFHVNGTFYADVAARMVNARLVARHTTLEHFSQVFDDAAAIEAKSLIVLMIPLLACVTAIVTLPRRRPAVPHIVFALHFMTMVLLLLMVLQTTLAIVLGAAHLVVSFHASATAVELVATGILLLGIAVYASLALRRAFALGATSSVMRAIAFTALFVPVLMGYRAVLFAITFFST